MCGGGLENGIIGVGGHENADFLYGGTENLETFIIFHLPIFKE